MADLADLKQRHDLLYRSLLTRAVAKPAGLDAADKAELVRQMDELLHDLQNAPTQDMSVETYDWLSTALINWQAASATILEEPREVAIPHPPGALRFERSQRFLSDNEIEAFLSEKARQLSLARKAGELTAQLERIAAVGSSRKAIAEDWRGAKAYFAYQIISGERSLTRQLTAGSFHHFADVWMDEVKEVWAFLLWKGRGSPDSADPDRDYLQACRELGNRLRAGASEKVPAADFLEAEDLLRREYLVKGRVVIVEPRPVAGDEERSRPAIGPGERMWALVCDKAARWAQWAGQGNPEDHWRMADRQVRDFYGSIIPAVKERDRSSTERVLRALYGCERIVTALEAALAVYFLDGQLVAELLERTPPAASSRR